MYDKSKEYSLSALCNELNLDRKKTLDFLIQKGYVADIRTITPRGLENGIRMNVTDAGQWPVYSSSMADILIKRPELVKEPDVKTGAEKNIPAGNWPCLTEVCKNLGIKFKQTKDWLIENGYIENSWTVTEKGRNIGIYAKENASGNVHLHYMQEAQEFVKSQKDKIAAFVAIGIKEVNTPDTAPSYYMVPIAFEETGLPEEFVLLDTETTGLEADDEIVELGIISSAGKVLFHSMFEPEKEMHWAAAKTTGISPKSLIGMPKFKDKWPEIEEILKNKTIVCHNMPFDRRQLNQTIERYGISHDHVDTVLKCKFIDSMDIAKKFVKSNSYKLEVLCEKLGIKDRQIHRATEDCLMTLKMLRRIELNAQKERIDNLISYELACEEEPMER